ncbi:MAG: tRNA (adenine-N1)-methyltransferase [Aeriscardovia sp.]|nr:tRNA (adenine-N1)-methyltransferase [Aeriscardovia sp.]
MAEQAHERIEQEVQKKSGAESGRPFRAGEKAQLTDRKGKKITIQLRTGETTQTDHGLVRHDDVIGSVPGEVITTVSALRHSLGSTSAAQRRTGGWQFVVLRPRLMDYQLSMPRGAQIMYPKDIAQALMYGDVRRGMRVLESGGGSGAMSLALVDTVGPKGSVTTIEKRADFADICRGNVEMYYGFLPRWWECVTDDFDHVASLMSAHSVDRILFDLLDPWNRLDEAWRVLAPGGIMVAYVTTVTQMSKVCETLRSSRRWTVPEIIEDIERSWKSEGLSVRPNHQMIGHTGFIVTSRTMAEGFPALTAHTHGSKDMYVDIDCPGELKNLELRGDLSDRKIRKTLRELGENLAILRGENQKMAEQTVVASTTFDGQREP